MKANANPFLPEFDKYFYHRTKRRNDLTKECKQITTFMSNKNNDNSWVTPHRADRKVPELCAGKLTLTVLRGRKLPGASIKTTKHNNRKWKKTTTKIC